MGFSYFNPNPAGLKVGDCTVRAIAKGTGKSWDEVYIGLCLQGLIMGDLPSANSVWSAYLRQQGFTRNVIPNTCPDCYTRADAREHMRAQLEDMMRDADDDKTRDAIRRCMEQIERA